MPEGYEYDPVDWMWAYERGVWLYSNHISPAWCTSSFTRDEAKAWFIAQVEAGEPHAVRLNAQLIANRMARP